MSTVPENDRELSDRLAIQDWFTAYARHVDEKNWEAWRQLFTTNARIDYTSVGGMAGERDEVSVWLEESLAPFPMTQHYVTNFEIVFEGADTAMVRAMFYNPMIFPGASEVSECGGYYHHQFLRTAEGWRSRNLVEENLWFKNDPR
jgi:3-phenylpropionate/cinnamic acid dioxygenase small subunit